MRRVILAFVSTVAGLVMLLSFKSHARPAALASLSTTDGSTSPTTTSNRATNGTTSPSDGTTQTPSTAAGGTHTVTGDESDTRYGPVEVKVTVTGGRVTAVDAIEYPTDTPRDWQINQYAIPVLDQEAVSANSAQIDMVSGATYTSEGFINSLQSALNQAGLS